MNPESTTIMNTPSFRRGHAAIGAITQEIEPYLPPDNINRKGYAECRTNYGLLTTMYKKAEESGNPERQYKELQQLERDLRRRLNTLDTTKGIPPKMTQLLDELRDALDDALSQNITVDFIIQGLADLLEDKPDARPAPKPEKVKMVTETRYRKVKEDLAAANEKIRKLNDENNILVMKVKQLEMERDRAGTQSDGTAHYWNGDEADWHAEE